MLKMSCTEGAARTQFCYDFVSWDYVVFGALLLISSGIGVFFAYRSRNNANADDYLLAGRRMTAFPVSLSLTASYISAITVLGTPAEFYIYGTMFWWFVLAYVISTTITAEIYVPLFYRLKITSTYEYLEMRFNKYVRILATTIFIVNTILYVGIVIYAPALALNEVTGLGIWWSVAVTAVVCTFYTTLGGLKAVVWTDVFQCLVMWSGFIAIIAKGCEVLGGFGNMWQIASDGGRIDYNHFDLDPKIRHTFWSLAVGGTVLWTGTNGTTQTMVQRYVCCKSEQEAKKACFLYVIGLLIVMILTGFSGLVMYAYYAGCDPYTKGWVGATDQLMPYFVLELLHDYPGLPGIYVCSAFSGALSTVSSGNNAMATVTVEDYIKPVKKLGPRANVLISKCLVIIYGVVCTLMAVLASQLGGVLQAAISINGLVAGPMLGLFTLAALLPWTNSIGAVVGLLSGLAVTIWVYIGSTIYPPTAENKRVLPLCTTTCAEIPDTSCGIYDFNATTIAMSSGYMTTTEVTTADPRPPIADFYSMSYLYYSPLGFTVTTAVGLLLSFATGYQKPSELPPETIFPLFDHIVFRCIPAKLRRKLWCGVRHDEKFSDEDVLEVKNKSDNEYYEMKDDMESYQITRITNKDLTSKNDLSDNDQVKESGIANSSFQPHLTEEEYVITIL